MMINMMMMMKGWLDKLYCLQGELLGVGDQDETGEEQLVDFLVSCVSTSTRLYPSGSEFLMEFSN